MVNTRRKLTILVDADDTIERLLISWVQAINLLYGTSVKYEDITQWDLSLAFPTLTMEQIVSPLEMDAFWETVQPINGAADALLWMMERGHDVYIVTASHYRTLIPKLEKCIFKHFPFLTWKNVIITENKQLIKGDILFDDAPHNLIGGDYIKVLVDTPQNRHFDSSGAGMYRMTSWSQSVPLIMLLEYGANINLS